MSKLCVATPDSIYEKERKFYCAKCDGEVYLHLKTGAIFHLEDNTVKP